jgi:hypothetical protein
MRKERDFAVCSLRDRPAMSTTDGRVSSPDDVVKNVKERGPTGA